MKVGTKSNCIYLKMFGFSFLNKILNNLIFDFNKLLDFIKY